MCAKTRTHGRPKTRRHDECVIYVNTHVLWIRHTPWHTRSTKQERWNQQAHDRQVHMDFLEEHRGTCKFSGKYAPQLQQTELIWTMPWGCWEKLEDKDVHCKEWEYIIEICTEEGADTTAHRIYGQRATLSVSYKPGDWDSVWAWIIKAGSGWHQAETAEDRGYSWVDQQWSKCDSGSKRCKLSRLWTLGPRGSLQYEHFKSLRLRKEAWWLLQQYELRKCMI